MPRFRITLRNFFVVAYLATCLAIALFWPLVDVSSRTAGLFMVIATAAYAALYLAPVVVLVMLADRLLRWLSVSPRSHDRHLSDAT